MIKHIPMLSKSYFLIISYVDIMYFDHIDSSLPSNSPWVPSHAPLTIPCLLSSLLPL